MIRPDSFVICVDARESDGVLVRGAVYRCTAVYGKFIRIDACQMPYGGFYRRRFKPAPSIEALRALLQSPRRLTPA